MTPQVRIIANKGNTGNQGPEMNAATAGRWVISAAEVRGHTSIHKEKTQKVSVFNQFKCIESVSAESANFHNG